MNGGRPEALYNVLFGCPQAPLLRASRLHCPRALHLPPEPMSEEHSSPIKNWKQLLVVVALAFLVPIILIALITQLVTGHFKDAPGDDSGVLARIKPVGDVLLAEASGPSGQRTGEQVFQQVCKNCHEAGLAGSPKFGDKAAWTRVIAQGDKVAVQHAISGIRGMPPKGGNPDLTDEEVQRGVAYMANAAGANWTAPPVAAAPAAGTAERTGQQVVEAVCSKCHGTGVNGAPKVGDQVAWRDRAKRGLASVTQSALRGHAGMPARGGMAELSDTEVKRAIEYMMNVGTGAVMTGTPQPAPRGSRDRCSARRRGGSERQARRQEGLRHGVHGLSRLGCGGCTEVR